MPFESFIIIDYHHPHFHCLNNQSYTAEDLRKARKRNTSSGLKHEPHIVLCFCFFFSDLSGTLPCKVNLSFRRIFHGYLCTGYHRLTIHCYLLVAVNIGWEMKPILLSVIAISCFHCFSDGKLRVRSFGIFRNIFRLFCSWEKNCSNYSYSGLIPNERALR